MRKVVLTGFGGPEVLVPTEAPEPDLPADGWIVELRAIGLNFAELVERRGLYRKDQRLPYEIGKEACGVIVQRGRDARGFELGQRVIVIKFSGGCYAERVAVRPGQVLPLPAHLDFAGGAAFAIAYATAWYAQEELARARPGETALIQAAAGATGSAAVRLAKARGLTVIGTAGGPEKVTSAPTPASTTRARTCAPAWPRTPPAPASIIASKAWAGRSSSTAWPAWRPSAAWSRSAFRRSTRTTPSASSASIL